MAKKTLNIGLVGYGFMGRAHSNGYRRVNNFFDLEHRAVLKAACARDREKIQAFASKWGYESVETDWRKLVERKVIRSHERVVVISTANGLKFADQKAAYHMGSLDGVKPTYRNMPVDLPPDPSQVARAITRHVERARLLVS